MKVILTCLSLLLFSSLSAQWSHLPGPAGGAVNCIETVNGEWWAGTNGGVYKSSDQGETWQPVPGIPTTRYVMSLEYNNGEILMGTVENVTSFNSFDDYNFWCYRSTDNGLNWTASLITGEYSPDPFELFRSGSYLIYSPSYGMALRSADNGNTWAQLPLPSFGSYLPVSHLGEALLCTTYDSLYYSNNSGNTWQNINMPTDPFGLDAVSLVGPSTILMYGIGSELFRTTNLGANWTTFDMPFDYSDVNRFVPLANGKIAALVSYPDNDEMIFVSSDNGAHWQTQSGSPNAMAIDMVAEGNNFGVATAKGFYKNYQGGNFLNPSNAGMLAADVSVLRVYDDQILAKANDGLSHSYDAGANWYTVYPQSLFESVVDILRVGDTLYALTSTDLFRSTDLGDSWEDMSGSNWWEDFFFDATHIARDGQRLLVVSDFDPLQYSDDGGQTWADLSTTVPWLRVTDFDVVDGKYYVCDFWDGIYRSFDGGASWQVQDFWPYHPVGLSYANNRLFQLGQSGTSYSDDYGLSWHKAQGLPDTTSWNTIYSVKAIVGDNTQLYAAVDNAGVYSSSDNGKHWAPMAEQLPNPRFYDLQWKNETLYASCVGGGIWKFPGTSSGTHQPALVNAGALEIFPNPATSAVFCPIEQSGHLRIFDALGRMVLEQEANAIESPVRIHINPMASGIYRIVFVSGNKVQVGSFVKP